MASFFAGLLLRLVTGKQIVAQENQKSDNRAVGFTIQQRPSSRVCFGEPLGDFERYSRILSTSLMTAAISTFSDVKVCVFTT